MAKEIIRYSLLLIIVLFVVTVVSATSIGEFQLDVDNVTIYQTCNNCTYCNFTRVMGPNNQTIISNIEATRDDTYFSALILKDNFSVVGDYNYLYNCGNSVEKDTGSIDFTITYTGGDLTPQVATVYILSIGTLIFFFILILLLITKLPSKDTTDDNDVILQISNLKHLRPVLWGISWIIILTLLFIVSNISIAYLPTFMIGNVLWVFYTIMFWLTIAAVPLWFIWIFTGIFRDKEFKRMIERGVNIKSTP